MELGQSCDQTGMAAFKPEQTYAGSCATGFAEEIGFDGHGGSPSQKHPDHVLGHGSIPSNEGCKEIHHGGMQACE